MKHFGEHFILDGYLGDKNKLNDQLRVLNFLNSLVEMLGMKKLAEPKVLFAEGNDKKDPGGWSGFVVILESHISIHTFPERGFVSIDVYSCKNGMDIAVIEKHIVDTFGLKDTETNFVKRGTRYPAFNI